MIKRTTKVDLKSSVIATHKRLHVTNCYSYDGYFVGAGGSIEEAARRGANGR